MIEYGLISRVDASVLEKTIDLICEEFPTQEIKVTEVGLYNGRTSKGIKEYIEGKGRFPVLTGVDNFRDNEQLSFYPHDARLLRGNSSEMCYQIEDYSQHLIFIDGLHTFSGVISDFFCYYPKVRIDGYLAFHDVAPHAQGKDWQRLGFQDDPDQHISVRRALNEINPFLYRDFELIDERYDPNDAAGGVAVFKRIK